MTRTFVENLQSTGTVDKYLEEDTDDEFIVNEIMINLAKRIFSDNKRLYALLQVISV